MPAPSFKTHVIAAARGVAASSPTPTLWSTALVVRTPIIVLEKALQIKKKEEEKKEFVMLCLH